MVQYASKFTKMSIIKVIVLKLYKQWAYYYIRVSIYSVHLLFDIYIRIYIYMKLINKLMNTFINVIIIYNFQGKK